MDITKAVYMYQCYLEYRIIYSYRAKDSDYRISVGYFFKKKKKIQYLIIPLWKWDIKKVKYTTGHLYYESFIDNNL